MVAPRHPKNKNRPLRSGDNKRAKNKKKRVVSKPIGTSTVQEENNLASGNAVAKTEDALSSAPVNAELARDAHKKSRRTTLKAREDSPVPPDTGQERKAHIRRDSFVVRLSLDENNQFGRTEIEHIASSRKQNFLELNGDHLVAFMKACINPQEALKSPTPRSASSELVRTSTPTSLQAEASLLTVDSRVLHAENQKFMSLVLSREESFVVEVHFQLRGSEFQFISMEKHSYEIRVYINEVTSGRFKLLTTQRSSMTQSALECTVPIEVPGLPHGLYRLSIVVILNGDIKMAGYRDGPMLQVN